MEKAFLEVFRNLELVGELRALLEEVVVTKVSINQKGIMSGFISAAGSGFIRNIFTPWSIPLHPNVFQGCL